MKITFICGSLQIGRDGVGDYTRRLAIKLLKQNHQVSIIAINDPFVSTYNCDSQISEDTKINVLRVPRKMPKHKRIQLLKEYLTDIDPDWISIQFVPFSFQSKGLPFGFGKFIRKIGGNANYHIMFHELWLGMPNNASKKNKIWGLLQRKLIKSFVEVINPLLVHTQTVLYQKQLSTIGISSTFLPLFSNIPIASKNCQPNQESSYLKMGKEIVLIIFGKIHPESTIVDFSLELSDYASKNNLKPLIKILGHSGPEEEHWLSVWNSRSIDVKVLGELSSNCISQELLNSSIGIATTSYIVIEKSGSVAAMREHGLPIICIGKSWHSREQKDFKQSIDIFEYKKGNLPLFLETKNKSNVNEEVSNIAQQFIDNLQEKLSALNLKYRSQ